MSTLTESVNANSIAGRLERAELQLADLGIPFERPSKSPEVNLVHAERILASPSPQSIAPGVYSPPAAKPNPRASQANGAATHSVSPVQLQSPEQPPSSSSTDVRHRAITTTENDPITRATLHGRANEALREESPLTLEARAKLLTDANTESDPLKRALLHLRAAN